MKRQQQKNPTKVFFTQPTLARDLGRQYVLSRSQHIREKIIIKNQINIEMFRLKKIFKIIEPKC